MEAVFPTRGRRWLRHEPRPRHRTMPITFAEIKEVDEEKENEEAIGASVVSVASDAMERRPVLEREFAEFRRRRARRGTEEVGVVGAASGAELTAISTSGSPAPSRTCSDPLSGAPS